MKSIPTMAAVVGLGLLTTSCMTTYDAQGRPVQSVDPGAAAVGAAAAGVLGYALAKERNDNKYYYVNGRRYYRPPYYHRHHHHPHRRGPW